MSWFRIGFNLRYLYGTEMATFQALCPVMIYLTVTLNESLAQDPPVVPMVAVVDCGVSSDDEGPKMLKVSKSSRR